MAYSKTTWTNGTTPINETNLNNIEVGVENIDKNIGTNAYPTYSNSSTYDVGNRVMYNNLLYQCTTAITVAEDFDSTKWTEINILDDLTPLVKTTYLKTNDDIDNYTTPGIYLCDNWNVVQSLTNSPTAYLFKMVVDTLNRPAYIRQTIYNGDTACTTYMRTKTSGGWNRWRKVNISYETALYSDTTGAKDNITLADSINNYTKIYILYRDNGNLHNGIVIDGGGTRSAELSVLAYGSDEKYHLKTKIIRIAGTSLTATSYCDLNLFDNTHVDTDRIYILQVWGWKESL